MADRHDGMMLIGIIACGHASARKCDTIVIFANEILTARIMFPTQDVFNIQFPILQIPRLLTIGDPVKTLLTLK